MKKLVIFDFDGTLIDSVTDVAICFNLALIENGFPSRDVSGIKKAIGGNLEQIVSKLLPEDQRTDSNIVSVMDCYRKIYIDNEKPNTRPYPGICDMLDTLKRQGALAAINTNKSQALTDDLVKKLFPGYDFALVVGYDKRYPSKPDPYGVNLIMDHCRLSKNDVIYIGDGRSDIDTAAAAQIDLLFVTWGQGTEDDIRSIAPERLMNSPQEICRHIIGEEI